MVQLRGDDRAASRAAELAVGDTLLFKLPFRSNGYLWELMTDPLPKTLKLKMKPRLETVPPGPDGTPASKWMVFEFEAVAPQDRFSVKFEYVRHSGDRRSEPARTLDASIRILPSRDP
ncbi:MAG: hypothetical protein ABS79_00355 [Planctomycetes bacterium SCN 63-9]|nr:MAG: hypothetical protein ABS79_00355 [Planctomycetes bacterium SCN 63-9]